MPFFAPFPLPTMIATGVARPSAQGQEMTRTLIACLSEVSQFFVTAIHTTKTSKATQMTLGTNTPDTLSAVFAIGALEADASSTSFTMPARVVSSPTLSARTVMNPSRFDVPEITLSPTALSTGILSPVTDASLTVALPLVIVPSAAKFSPGRTTNKSLIFSSETGISFSPPSVSMRTVLGARSSSPLIAEVVLPLLYDSSVLPSVMSARIIAADSK